MTDEKDSQLGFLGLVEGDVIGRKLGLRVLRGWTTMLELSAVPKEGRE